MLAFASNIKNLHPKLFRRISYSLHIMISCESTPETLTFRKKKVSLSSYPENQRREAIYFFPFKILRKRECLSLNSKYSVMSQFGIIIRVPHFFDMEKQSISPNKDGSVAHVDIISLFEC